VPRPIRLLPNLSQEVLHQAILDVQPGPTQVLDDRCRLCDPPQGLARPATPSVPMTLSILDGVFEPLEADGVLFRQASALTPEEVAVIEEQVRRRVLHWFSRHGLLDPDDARDMLAWTNTGFSLDASVCIAGHDRAGLGRLLRYCVRPPFALERIEQVDEDRIVYRLPEPQRNARTALSLTPLELIDHLAALIPPPRLHRRRYHGVLAPNAPLRAAATAYGRDADLGDAPLAAKAPAAAVTMARSPAH